MQNQTIFFKNDIKIENTATIVGPKEHEGPIGRYFDKYVKDDLLGQKSYEKAETKMHISTIKYLLNKTGYEDGDIDLCLMGDLMDEISGCNFTMRELDIPFMGVYNACASMCEEIFLASFLIVETLKGLFVRLLVIFPQQKGNIVSRWNLATNELHWRNGLVRGLVQPYLIENEVSLK